MFLPYLVVLPIFALLLATWTGIWDIRPYMPTSPRQVIFLAVIFENPHIVASTLMWFDKEYIQYYRQKLIISVLISVILCIAVVLTFGMSGFLLFLYGWTVAHVIRQQIGIGRMMNRQSSRLYEAWAWMVLTSSLLVAITLGHPELHIQGSYVTLLDTALTVSIVIACMTAAILVTRIKRHEGKLYILANSIMLIATAACAVSGYPFFAILIPRAIHDITAYIIYTNHDTNRNTPLPHNVIYRYTAAYFPIALICIVVSIALASWVTFTPTYFATYFAAALAIFHYTSESFVWKSSGIHRKSLHFAT